MNRKTNNLMEISLCPACQGTLFKKKFTKKERDFWRCATCGLEKQFPLPTLEELKNYYDESYTAGMYKLFTDANNMKQLTAQQRFREIKPYCPTGRWLDVGCSNGIFVSNAIKNGLNAEGIDLSEVAVKQAQQRELPVYCSTIEAFYPGYAYDTVTAFDVLEHVLDPYDFLRSIRRLVSNNGRIALSVPNQSSLFCQIMGKNWFFYIPEEHLHYFNPSNITKLFSRAGFEVKRCVPTYKPLTYSYSLTQFMEYNPLIYELLNVMSKVIPHQLREKVIPLYIGEMMIIAKC